MDTKNNPSPLLTRANLFTQVLQELPEVCYIGNEILRQPTQLVTLEEGIEIGQQLADVLLKYRQIAGIGRGLAAPQIGIAKSVFITYVDDKVQLFINPSLQEIAPTTNFYRELCLSSGIMAADVERPEWIVLRWTDEQGQEQTQKFDGFLARLLQHEEAHLRGKLNLDEAAPHGIEFTTFEPAAEQLRSKR